MTAERLADAPVKPPPVEARCAACGGWIATVPAGTPWARGRCYNRINGHACRLYGRGQTVHLRS
jgi:hypothetical protein